MGGCVHPPPPASSPALAIVLLVLWQGEGGSSRVATINRNQRRRSETDLPPPFPLCAARRPGKAGATLRRQQRARWQHQTGKGVAHGSWGDKTDLSRRS
eukprot:scaffold86310_cov31-Tisochrysis_lutea.AAC.5